MDLFSSLWRPLLTALVFAILGVVILGIVWAALVKVLPFSMRKEIEVDQNVALGIVMGSLILGISLIIAASIHG